MQSLFSRALGLTGERNVIMAIRETPADQKEHCPLYTGVLTTLPHASKYGQENAHSTEFKLSHGQTLAVPFAGESFRPTGR